jgi:tRNA A-37 threonylcarbamoyl transferase component Bud32
VETFAIGGVRWQAPCAADAEALVRAAWDRLRSGAAPDRRGRLKDLYRLALRRPERPDHLLKVRRAAALRPRRVSKSRRALALARILAQRGLPVALPLAAGERRRFGRVVDDYLLVPLLDDFEDLAARAAAGDLSADDRHRLARALGRLVAQAHRTGLDLHDFTPTNVLVHRRDPADLRLIDFERARLRRRLGFAARARALARLELGLPSLLSGAQRHDFFRAYAGDDPELADDWARRADRAAQRVAVRRARHARRRARDRSVTAPSFR